MSNDAMAIIGCIGAVGIVGLIGWRVGTYKGQPRRGWCLHRWLFISLALFAVAALAGCDAASRERNPRHPAPERRPAHAITYQHRHYREHRRYREVRYVSRQGQLRTVPLPSHHLWPE